MPLPRLRLCSVKAKIIFIVLSTTGVALFLSFAAFVSYDAGASRHKLVDEIGWLAQTIGSNTFTALRADPRAPVQEMISILSANPHIIAASVYTPDKKVIASYHKEGLEKAFPLPAKDSFEIFHKGRVLLARPVMRGDKQLGAVFIESDLLDIAARRRDYISRGLAMGILAVLAAVFVSQKLQEMITVPILSLVSVAKKISGKKDYTVRAAHSAGAEGELGELVDAFNAMLEQIQQRDEALEYSRRDLEMKVKTRTGELEKVNSSLAENEKVLRKMLEDVQRANQELMEARNQLIQSEKMASVGTLSSGLAHEIKNPLAIILQGIERIEEILQGYKDEKGLKYLQMAKNAAVRANKIIMSLLEFSRSASLQMRPLQVHRVIDSAVDLIEHKAKKENVNIVKEYGPEDCFIDGDYVVLQQCFFNLFNNAMHAMPGGGVIHIATSIKREALPDGMGPCSEIRIRDTGHGIPEEKLDKIFVPFFTTKSPGHGTGLGLSMVYMILERHQGSIRAESKPGEGATFIITLPIIEPNDEAHKRFI